jgi:PPOX class probable F420-dependent enzyme
MADLSAFSAGQYLSIETFRKNGEGVRTPVWFAEDTDGTLHIWTAGESGKVKRIRNNSQVNVAPCTPSGKITGEWVAGQAVIDDTDAGIKHTRTVLRKKIGFLFSVFVGFGTLMARGRPTGRVSIRVTRG